MRALAVYAVVIIAITACSMFMRMLCVLCSADLHECVHVLLGMHATAVFVRVEVVC
jgi:hypothetical protein